MPPDSPLIAAFQRLDAATAYRVRMEMSTTDPRAQQAMQQMGGMDHFDKAMVRPDTQYISFHMSIPAIDAPRQVRRLGGARVVKGKRMARKFDTPAEPRILAHPGGAIAKQLAQTDMTAAMSLGQAAWAVPWVRSVEAVTIASPGPQSRHGGGDHQEGAGVLPVDLLRRAGRMPRRAAHPTM